MATSETQRASEWDPLETLAREDPVAAHARLRAECPVAWTAEGSGGFWSLTRYDDIVSAARDTETFSNTGNPRFGDVPSPPIESDRPEHTKYRRLLAPYFGHDRVAALEPRVREIVCELLAPLLARGECDIASEFTYPLPVHVLCALLKLPVEDAQQLKRWAEQVFNARVARDFESREIRTAEAQLREYGRALVSTRLAMQLDPDEDLVTGLITKPAGDQLMTADEIVAMIRLLLSAGHNSTTSALGNCVLAIARDNSIQQQLRSAPELISVAVDEFLRYESPVTATKRLALRDARVDGRLIHSGEQVFLVWGAANRDDRHFDRADECRIDRGQTDNLVFGFGIHRCIGRRLALMEARVVLEELLARTGWIELAGRPVRTSWERYGVSSLPIRLRHGHAEPTRA